MTEHEAPQTTEDVTVYDNTMIKAFLSCPRFFYWRHERHLDNIGRSVPLVFGIAIHAGLDAYFQSHLDGENETQQVVSAIEAFVELFTIPGDDKRNLDNGVRILQNYIKQHPVAKEHWTVEAVESVFEIVLDPVRRIHFYGRMDLIIHWPGYGHIVVDHKTASWISDNYMKAHATDRQFTGYVVGVGETYKTVYGAMVNILEVPKTLTREPKTMRELVTKNKYDKAIWTLDTLHIIEQITRCREKQTWPMNAPFYCTAWNRMCEYFGLCSSHQHPEDVSIDESLFVKKAWTPFLSEVEK